MWQWLGLLSALGPPRTPEWIPSSWGGFRVAVVSWDHLFAHSGGRWQELSAERREDSPGCSELRRGFFLLTCFVEIPWASRAEDGTGVEWEIGQAEPPWSLVAPRGITPSGVLVWVWICAPFMVAQYGFSHLHPSVDPGSGPRKKILRLGPVGRSSLLTRASDYCDFSFPIIPWYFQFEKNHLNSRGRRGHSRHRGKIENVI